MWALPIQATYTNGLIAQRSKTLVVTPPLQITGLANAGANPLIVWGSTPGANYQVLVTTNLTQPFATPRPDDHDERILRLPYDTSPPAPQKFYEIEMCPDLRFKNRFSGRRRGDESQSSAILQPGLKTPPPSSEFGATARRLLLY